MERARDEALERAADHLNREGVVGCADFAGSDGIALSMPTLSAALRSHGYRGADLHGHTIETEAETTTIAYDADRFGNNRSAEAAWSLLRREAKRERVERRVEDWLRRLGELRAQVEHWANERSSVKTEIIDRPPVVMNEDLMREYGVEACTMPSFDVAADGRRAVRFQPRGLWTLAGNGRVDLITPATALILVDRSEPLSSPSRWTLQALQDRDRGVPLTGETFTHLVETGRLA